MNSHTLTTNPHHKVLSLDPYCDYISDGISLDFTGGRSLRCGAIYDHFSTVFQCFLTVFRLFFNVFAADPCFILMMYLTPTLHYELFINNFALTMVSEQADYARRQQGRVYYLPAGPKFIGYLV